MYVFIFQSAVQNTFNDPPQPTLNQNDNQSNNYEAVLNDIASSDGSVSSSISGVPQVSPTLNRSNSNSFSPNSQFSNNSSSMNNNSLNSSSSSNQLPNVNINLQRTLNYTSPRDRAVVPQGFFQWSMFIVAFPFKFLFTTFMDFATFFCKIKIFKNYK